MLSGVFIEYNFYFFHNDNNAERLLESVINEGENYRLLEAWFCVSIPTFLSTQLESFVMLRFHPSEAHSMSFESWSAFKPNVFSLFSSEYISKEC